MLLPSFTFSLPAVPLRLPSLSFTQNSPARESRNKRGTSPLQLVQYSSVTASDPGSANASTPSLSTPVSSNDLPIPGTPFSLRFGNLGSYLHPWDLETLLITVRAEIQAELTAHGRNARLPSAEYSKDLVGLQFWIQKMPWDTVNLAWAELAIVVEGLWLYFVDQKHDRETLIDAINHLMARQIAFGWVGKPHLPLGDTSSTGDVRKGLQMPAPQQTS